jgi:hypothetical protein
VPPHIWEIYWESTFERSLAAMGLTLEIFERLGNDGVASLLHANPFESRSTFELAGTGHRYLFTRFRFPDLPAMAIAYAVEPETRTVTIKGAKKVWDEDLVPDLS